MPVACTDCGLELPDVVKIHGSLRQVSYCIACGGEVE